MVKNRLDLTSDYILINKTQMATNIYMVVLILLIIVVVAYAKLKKDERNHNFK